MEEVLALMARDAQVPEVRLWHEKLVHQSHVHFLFECVVASVAY